MSHAPRVALLLLPNFTLAPVGLFIDVLRLAADEGDRSRPIRLHWTFIAPSRKPVNASCGLEFVPWELLGDPSRFDYIVVCGGLLRRRHDDDALVEEWLSHAKSCGAIVIGLCTGVFTLAQAGLLADAKACVSWYHAHEFVEEFPDVSVVATELFLVDEKCVTCAGGRGAADMAAWIIERHWGAGIARKSLDVLLFGPGTSRDMLQPRPSVADGVGDERVRKAILLMEERRDRSLPIPALAQAVGLSRRRLERLFVSETGYSPAAYALHMRLNHADWLIATCDRPLTDIALECGFSDIAHLSRSYKAKFGRRPSDSRDRRADFVENERRPFLKR